jgi:hypothetical protein
MDADGNYHCASPLFGQTPFSAQEYLMSVLADQPPTT